MRVWYDTAEYSDMLTSDVRAQSKSFSWQEAAQNWAKRLLRDAERGDERQHL